MQIRVMERELAQTIVGLKGLAFLEDVLQALEAEAQRRGWPLLQASVYPQVDWEFEGKQYLIVWLEFGCPQEAADYMLANLWPLIDSHLAELPTFDRAIVQPRLLFKVQAAG